MVRRWAAIGFAALVGMGLVAGSAACASDTGSGEHAESGTTTSPARGKGTTTTTTSATPTSTTAARDPELGNGTTITLAFAGDMNFEGTLRSRLDRDPATALGPFAAQLRAADLAVGNLETAIATGGTRAAKQFTFRAPPTAVDALRAAGFDAVSMANNHGMDFGADGLQETLAVQQAQPDRFLIGIGADEAAALTPSSTVVRGQRVAVIAATQVLDSSLIDAWTATPSHAGVASAKRVGRLLQAVAAARADHDTVVVFLHWGQEGATCPSADQTRLAAQLVDAGADIVVGGHAHRLEGAGRLGPALVAYGLGNFLFRASSAAGSQTGVLEVTVTGRRIDGYRWTPGVIVDSVPAPLSGAAAAQALRQWDALRACTGLTP